MGVSTREGTPSVLVGPEPGWENGLHEMAACLAENWPLMDFALELSDEPFKNRRRAFKSNNPKGVTSSGNSATTVSSVTSSVPPDTTASSATSC